MHFVGPDQLHGFERRLTTDIYPADLGWTPNWEDPEGRFDWWFHDMDRVFNAGVAGATNQLDFDDEVGFRAVRELRDHACCGGDQPWFLTLSFTHPHDPYVMRRAYWDRYDHEAIDLPRVGATTSIPTRTASGCVRSSRWTPLSSPRRWCEPPGTRTTHASPTSTTLLDTLEQTGMAGDTVVIFTADHGDHLGERGLGYKMSFFEPSTRIPLVVPAPGADRGVVYPDPVSLYDVLPMLVDLAGGDPAGDLGHQVDGGSLVPQLHGDRDPDRTVLGEYLGESAVAPIFMIRRQNWKYVWSDPDGAQLYDLAADPDERRNLATVPDHADVAAAFRDEIDKHWQPARVHAEVLDSQRARRLVDRALRTGRYTSWDHVPTPDSAAEYMRNHLDLRDVEVGRRFPRVPTGASR